MQMKISSKQSVKKIRVDIQLHKQTNKQKYGNQLLSTGKKALEKLVDLPHLKKKLKELTKLKSLQRMKTLC